MGHKCFSVLVQICMNEVKIWKISLSVYLLLVWVGFLQVIRFLQQSKDMQANFTDDFKMPEGVNVRTVVCLYVLAQRQLGSAPTQWDPAKDKQLQIFTTCFYISCSLLALLALLALGRSSHHSTETWYFCLISVHHDLFTHIFLRKYRPGQIYSST